MRGAPNLDPSPSPNPSPHQVLIFEMLAGRPPFPSDPGLMRAHARLVHEIVHGRPASLPPSASVAAAAIVGELLQRDEVARLHPNPDPSPRP